VSQHGWLLLAIYFRWLFLAAEFSSSRPPDLTTTSRTVDELNNHREAAAQLTAVGADLLSRLSFCPLGSRDPYTGAAAASDRNDLRSLSPILYALVINQLKVSRTI